MSDKLNEKLIVAVKVGWLNEVQRLLVEGADPQMPADEEEKTAWEWAELDGKTDIIQVFKKMSEVKNKRYSAEKKRNEEIWKGYPRR